MAGLEAEGAVPMVCVLGVVHVLAVNEFVVHQGPGECVSGVVGLRGEV